MKNFSKALKDPSERDEKESIFDRLRSKWYDWTRNSWFERRIEFPFKDFCTGIRNLIKWFPIVWKDRDWDDAYIMYVLKFKIANTRDRILRNNIIADHEQAEIKRDTNICIKLIDSFTEAKYELEYQDFHKSEMQFVDYVPEEGWNEDPDFKIELGTKEIVFKTIEDNLDQYFKKYPLDYRKALKWIEKNQPDRDPNDPENRTYVALVMSQLRQEKANALLWKIINAKIENWWD